MGMGVGRWGGQQRRGGDGKGGQWGGRDRDGETGKGRSSGKGREWEDRETFRVRLRGGNGEGATGKGGGRGRGQRGGGEEGVRGEGISQMDMMKCKGGMRLHSFLTFVYPCNAGYPS